MISQNKSATVEDAASQMVGESGDIKISVDADREMKDAAAEISNEYDKDIELQKDE